MDPLRFILGSQSPRRKELFSYLEIPYEIILPEVEENSIQSDLIGRARELSELKIRDVFKRAGEDAFVLTADTLVGLDTTILGKPKDREEAREMLKLLSGKSHRVVTAVSLAFWSSNRLTIQTHHCESKVRFQIIGDDRLERYLETDESIDKAGAYGIQGAALSFIAEINGSYSNIVGLPLAEVHTWLKNTSADLGFSKNWRDCFKGCVKKA